jgi:hypothetical protein
LFSLPGSNNSKAQNGATSTAAAAADPPIPDDLK